MTLIEFNCYLAAYEDVAFDNEVLGIWRDDGGASCHNVSRRSAVVVLNP